MKKADLQNKIALSGHVQPITMPPAQMADPTPMQKNPHFTFMSIFINILLFCTLQVEILTVAQRWSAEFHIWWTLWTRKCHPEVCGLTLLLPPVASSLTICISPPVESLFATMWLLLPAEVLSLANWSSSWVASDMPCAAALALLKIQPYNSSLDWISQHSSRQKNYDTIYRKEQRTERAHIWNKKEKKK